MAQTPPATARDGGIAMTDETDIARHYTTETLLERIRAALAASGADPEAPRPEDLKPVDEFHTGGLEATEALLAELPMRPGLRVLDIGCGIGGTARHVAAIHGAQVTGVDLTPGFVAAARELSEMVGLGDRVRFVEGSALALPVGDASADLALILHVGMNIADKERLIAEAARALAPGGHLAVFDVMRGPGAGELLFPVPWAARAELSFVAAPEAYAEAARKAVLVPVARRDRSAFARAFFDRVRARMEAAGPPPLGIHLLMGETARDKIANYVAMLEDGRIAPVEMIFRKPG
jgi:SAM-dependent methyltransferase